MGLDVPNSANHADTVSAISSQDTSAVRSACRRSLIT
jgi:hypothetical protein